MGLPTRRAALIALGMGLTGAALALNKPSGPVVLSITGNIAHHNIDGRADFDMTMLAALAQHTLITTSPWHSRPTRFTGPLLRDVLTSVGAAGQKLLATALNNYQIEIPIEDAQNYSVLLVRLVDGQPVRIRDKGPLLIMYPFDQTLTLHTPVHYSRAIWQLRRMDVL